LWVDGTAHITNLDAYNMVSGGLRRIYNPFSIGVVGNDGGDTLTLYTYSYQNRKKANININSDGDIIMTPKGGDVRVNGNLHVTGGFYNDIAELWHSSESFENTVCELVEVTKTYGEENVTESVVECSRDSDLEFESGDVVCTDTENEGRIKYCDGDYDVTVMSVVNYDATQIIGGAGGEPYPISLAGNVPVKVDCDEAAIKIGDALVTDDKAGFARKFVEKRPPGHECTSKCKTSYKKCDPVEDDEDCGTEEVCETHTETVCESVPQECEPASECFEVEVEECIDVPAACEPESVEECVPRTEWVCDFAGEECNEFGECWPMEDCREEAFEECTMVELPCEPDTVEECTLRTETVCQPVEQECDPVEECTEIEVEECEQVPRECKQRKPKKECVEEMQSCTEECTLAVVYEPDETSKNFGSIFAKALEDCDSGKEVIRAWLI